MWCNPFKSVLPWLGWSTLLMVYLLFVNLLFANWWVASINWSLVWPNASLFSLRYSGTWSRWCKITEFLVILLCCYTTIVISTRISDQLQLQKKLPKFPMYGLLIHYSTPNHEIGFTNSILPNVRQYLGLPIPPLRLWEKNGFTNSLLTVSG